MAKKLSKLQSAQQEAEEKVVITNNKIEELGYYSSELYASLRIMQWVFDHIRNVPDEDRIKFNQLKKIRLDWKNQADNIANEYKIAKVKVAGKGAAGVGAGVAVAALGPTAAMGIATTFGVASTGTAISALSGAAAANAALAWLGGGALAAGGGGMAAGHVFLTLAGPVGWAIAGVSIIASSIVLIKTKKEKDRLEIIFTLICDRDIKSYELAIVELDERIKRIIDESKEISDAIDEIDTFGTDYHAMTEEQQYKLGAFVNLMESSTMLLVNPILGLQPKYSEQDFQQLCDSDNDKFKSYFEKYKNMIIYLANLLYKIKLDDNDDKLLIESLRKNKEFLSSVNMSKDEFDIQCFQRVKSALNYQYAANQV